MSAGTLTLTNNSARVSGNGTSFSTELAAGDFIVMKTGGVTYTLPVKTVESDSALTLSRPYAGPAVSGSAWTAMPRDTLNSISAQIAADTAYAIRQRVLEIDNWYQLLEVNGDVTIKMADGSAYTGPSWVRLIDVMKTVKIEDLIPLADQIHTDAAQIAADKPVLIQARTDAEAAAAAALASETASSGYATSADSAKTAAEAAQGKAEKAAQDAASHNPVAALAKGNNLSDLEDRVQAWLNVRPTGPTTLAADPVDDKDAATKGWVKTFIASVKSVLASWSVINNDTTAPANNTTVYGGDVWSTYQVAGADYVKLGCRAKVTIGGESTGELRLVDSRTGGASKTWAMPAGGGTLLSTDDIGTSGSKIPKVDARNTWSSTQVFNEAGLVTSTTKTQQGLAGSSGQQFASRIMNNFGDFKLGAKFFCNFDSNSSRRAIVQITTDADAVLQTFVFDQPGSFSSGLGSFQNSGSDVRIKYDFAPVAPGHQERIAAIGVAEYKYNGTDIVSRGFLAQQMGDIDDRYVFSGGEAIDENGEAFEVLNVDTRAVIADLVSTVQDLMKEVAALKAAK